MMKKIICCALALTLLTSFPLATAAHASDDPISDLGDNLRDRAKSFRNNAALFGAGGIGLGVFVWRHDYSFSGTLMPGKFAAFSILGGMFCLFAAALANEMINPSTAESAELAPTFDHKYYLLEEDRRNPSDGLNGRLANLWNSLLAKGNKKNLVDLDTSLANLYKAGGIPFDYFTTRLLINKALEHRFKQDRSSQVDEIAEQFDTLDKAGVIDELTTAAERASAKASASGKAPKSCPMQDELYLLSSHVESGSQAGR